MNRGVDAVAYQLASLVAALSCLLEGCLWIGSAMEVAGLAVDLEPVLKHDLFLEVEGLVPDVPAVRARHQGTGHAGLAARAFTDRREYATVKATAIDEIGIFLRWRSVL